MFTFIQRKIVYILCNLWMLFQLILLFPWFIRILPYGNKSDFFFRNVSLNIFLKLLALGGLHSKFQNSEKLPKPGQYILAIKHQSWWETFAIIRFIPNLRIVHRSKLPFIAIFLDHVQPYVVDRANPIESLKNILCLLKRDLKTYRNLPIAIFPEGTRRAYGMSPKYHINGIYAIYVAGKIPIYPVATDSGYYLGTKSGYFKIRHSGTIHLRCLDPIPPGLSKEEVKRQLVERIETESDKMYEEAKKTKK